MQVVKVGFSIDESLLIEESELLCDVQSTVSSESLQISSLPKDESTDDVVSVSMVSGSNFNCYLQLPVIVSADETFKDFEVRGKNILLW